MSSSDSAFGSEPKVSDLIEPWTESASDPLLSEHTLLKVADNAGWILCEGEPVSAVLTLVPTSRHDVGLVELASASDRSRLRAWRKGLPELMEQAGLRGYRSLEVIDRGGVLIAPDSVIIRSVVRMVAEGAGTGRESPDVETATAGDFDAILDLIQEVFAGHPENGSWTKADLEQRMSRNWFDPPGVLIRRVSGDVVGLCWTKVHPDGIGEIYLVAVSPTVTGQGLGRTLVEHGVSYLSGRRGCEQVLVYADEANRPARRLYESVGFVLDRVDRRIGLTV